jgi:site-specific DNA-cytosine methylase
MNSVDLFTGIGGFAFALKGIARPLAYCEIDPLCSKILRSNIKKGLLPNAPICNDIRLMGAEWGVLPTRVDMITAGFPCTGFSNIGQREGFENEQSSLFSEVLRMTDLLQPNLVLMENVPPILKRGMGQIIAAYSKRGYELRWCTMSGYDVGARHLRRRWICLAVKCNSQGEPFYLYNRDAYFPWKIYDWGKEIVPRMKTSLEKFAHKRCGALGNAIIPDVIRHAFLYLLSGMPADITDHSKFLSEITLKRVDVVRNRMQPLDRDRLTTFPTAGYSKSKESNTIYDATTSHHAFLQSLKETRMEDDYELTFDPSVYQPPGNMVPSSRKKLPTLVQPVKAKLWSTPRHSNVTTSHFVTKRNMKDLPTQVRFERDTPNECRNGWINPEFVEWLMGYPIDWTRITARDGDSHLSDCVKTRCES